MLRTNDEARWRPAIGVLQEERDDLDRVHQDAIPKEERREVIDPIIEKRFCLQHEAEMVPGGLG